MGPGLTPPFMKCRFPLGSAGLRILLPPKVRFFYLLSPPATCGLEAAERQRRVAFTRVLFTWVFDPQCSLEATPQLQRMFLLLLLQPRHLNPVLPPWSVIASFTACPTVEVSRPARDMKDLPCSMCWRRRSSPPPTHLPCRKERGHPSQHAPPEHRWRADLGDAVPRVNYSDHVLPLRQRLCLCNTRTRTF